MKSSKKYFLIFTFVGVILVSTLRGQESNNYFTCSYKSPYEDVTQIAIKKIDIDLKKVVDSVFVPLKGELTFAAPLKLQYKDKNYFVIFTAYGLMGKNTHPAYYEMANYAVVNQDLKLVNMGTLDSIFIYDKIDTLSPNPMIDYRYSWSESLYNIGGEICLDDNGKIYLIPAIRFYPESEDSVEIGGIKNTFKFTTNNNQLYWALPDSSVYIINVDRDTDKLNAITNVHVTEDYSYLFGLDGDSLVYSFIINANYVGLNDTLSRPSFVKIYRSDDFALLDSVTIKMPPLKYGYVLNEYGSCDEIGPYLVYYYFSGEGMGIFSPAMLFIFDTRTYETTWLRVGWR